MKFFVVKQLNQTFKPAWDSDLEAFKKIKAGEIMEVEIKKARNPKLHNKFFSLLNLAFSNQDLYDNKDEFREDLTIEAGYYIERVNKFTGEVKKYAKSISFASMDDLEFQDLYSDILRVIVKLLGCTNEDIIENIEQYY